MLTCGNRKLGRRLIWSFSLPAGDPDTCPGASPACLAHCYARAFERYRPAAAARYRDNLRLSRRRDFARRIRAFLVAHAVRVVRVHVGGDFYSPRYATKWLRVMERSPTVLFYFYTRSWRVPGVKAVLDAMAGLSNCVAWYSADRATGLPAAVPPGVRVAWLQTSPDDPPPAGSHLAFRVRRLRPQPSPPQSPVCPAEVGSRPRVTCERCGHCWRPAGVGRVPLPVVPTDAEEDPRAR